MFPVIRRLGKARARGSWFASTDRQNIGEFCAEIDLVSRLLFGVFWRVNAIWLMMIASDKLSPRLERLGNDKVSKVS